MSDDYCDDGDNGGPTSHRYLYEIEREDLFTRFFSAVRAVRVDGGPLCASYEAPALSRVARAVQARVDPGDPCEAKLGTLATVLRVLLSRAGSRDKGEDQSYQQPISDLERHFQEVRAEVGDMLPVSGTWSSLVVVPDDPSEVDAITPLRADSDGRLWGQLDPGDVVSEGEDVVSEEGGYRWHTDGRPPEPLLD